MSIIFTIVCRDYEKVLCEYTDYHGNFEQVTRSLIKKAKGSAKASISYDDSYLFHFLTDDKLTYMCMCEMNYPVETAFEFLEVIKENFENQFTKEAIESAYAYSFNKDFRNTIQSKMKFYNTHIDTQANNQLERIKKGLINTKTMLLNSEELLSQRGEKVKLIVKKADLLRADSISFFEGAMKVKQRARRKRIRLIIGLLLVFIIIYGILTLVCHGITLPGCF